MHITIFSLCVDHAGLGRMQPSMLSEQQRMELLFTPNDASNGRKSLGENEDDACTWNGVDCNDSMQVTRINWGASMKLNGEIDFAMLPPRLTYLSIFLHHLTGSFDVSFLPQNLQFVSLQACNFTGTLDLGNLPRGLEEFYSSDNRITAVVNVENLPETLRVLVVREPYNTISDLHIGKLPERMRSVVFERCRITRVTYEDRRDHYRVKGV